MNQIDELLKLKNLLESGVIDENDFEKLKKEIINNKPIPSFTPSNNAPQKILTKKILVLLVISLLFILISLLIYFNFKASANDIFNQIPTGQNLSLSDIDKIQLEWNDDSSASLSSFLHLNSTSTQYQEISQSSYAKFIDIDGDGIRELQAGFNNGVAAGIETTGLFIQEKTGVYKKLLLYDGYIVFKDHLIDIDFNSTSKYFYTCGACTIWLPEDQPTQFSISFDKGMITFLPTDDYLNKKAFKNLSYLKRKGDLQKNGSNQDNGTRKAYLENVVLYYYNNNGDWTETERLFYENYFASDAAQIWNEIKAMIIDLNNQLNIGEQPIQDKKVQRPQHLEPIEVFENFRKAVKEKDWSMAQDYIHEDGVFFYLNGRIKKTLFTNSNLSKLRGGFLLQGYEDEETTRQFPPDNTTGEEMLNYLLIDGQVSIGDNYTNAAGFDAMMESPHISFDNMDSQGGFFINGSKIVVVNPQPDENNERLLVELYPDNGEWKVFSIGKWYWTP
jgi:hypothetical protein